MIGALAGLAVLVVGGAVVATSVRDARLALVGLTPTLVLGTFLADPIPTLGAIAVRLVGAVLVVVLLRGTLGRGERATAASPLGWPALVLVALGAAVVGYAVSGGLSDASGATGTGLPSVIAIAGVALVVLGIGPAFVASAPIHTTIGLLLLAQGTVLVRTAFAGPPTDLEQVAFVALLLACSAGGAAFGAVARRAEEQPSPEPGRSAPAPVSAPGPDR